MAHFPKPFYVKARKVWRVQVHGHQHNLGPDEAEAHREYHRLMSRPAAVAGHLVAGVVDAFLDWCQKHRKPRTYLGHKNLLTRFVKSLPDPTAMEVAALKPHHVQRWVDANPGWGQTEPPQGSWTAGTRCILP